MQVNKQEHIDSYILIYLDKYKKMQNERVKEVMKRSFQGILLNRFNVTIRGLDVYLDSYNLVEYNFFISKGNKVLGDFIETYYYLSCDVDNVLASIMRTDAGSDLLSIRDPRDLPFEYVSSHTLLRMLDSLGDEKYVEIFDRVNVLKRLAEENTEDKDEPPTNKPNKKEEEKPKELKKSGLFGNLFKFKVMS